MGMITISADTLPQLMTIIDGMINDALAVSNGVATAPNQASEPVAEAARRTTRKKAEAAAPIMPSAANGADHSGSPFAAAPPVSNGFAPGGFAPNGADPHANAGVEKPLVTKVKGLLDQLSAQHGEASVYSWAMVKGFGLPTTVTKDEFLAKYIHEQPDAKLAEVYRQGGGA